MKRADNECPETDHLAGCEFVFVNSTVTDIQLDLFQTLADYMLALGLTTEASTPQRVPFGRAENLNVRFVGAPGPGGEQTEAEVLSPPGGSASSDVMAAPRPYKICFLPHTNFDSNCVYPKSLCGEQNRSFRPQRSQIPIRGPKRTCNQTRFPLDESKANSQIQASGSASVNVIASHEFIQRLLALVNEDAQTDVTMQDPKQVARLEEELRAFDMKPVRITIYMRHTEGMIYYIGQVARRALDPDLEEGRRDTFVKADLPYHFHPEMKCRSPGQHCNYVFRLGEGATPTSDNFLSVNYDGRRYSIANPDPYRQDLSSLTFDILKQLIALNSSAKSLPQSSVITAVGGQ